jgi:hypothetical protein
MQMLHTTPESAPTATSALAVPSCSEFAQTSVSCIAPYLHRVCWLLINAERQFLTGISGTDLHWAASANAVPEQQRYTTFTGAKSAWLRLRELSPLQDKRLAINPVDFYAHPSTPSIWCALDD